MGDDDPGRHGHLRLRGETLGYNPTYGNGQCTDWAERQFHAWTGTYINTLGINGHSGNALDWAYNAADNLEDGCLIEGSAVGKAPHMQVTQSRS
jgi:surface antigen